MKSVLVAGVFLFGSLAALSAPEVFTVKAPAWTKLAVATTDGLNVRKSPSTTAPRLMYDEMEIEEYYLPVIYSAKWVTRPTKTSVPITFDTPMPIVSEKDGWFEVLNCGPSFKENGWISAKYAKAVDPQNLKSVESAKYRNAWIDKGNNGVYMITLDYNEMEGDATFRVGKLVDGVVVSPYELYCPVAVYDEAKKPGIRKVNDYFEFTFNNSVSADDFEYDPLASKLSPEVLDTVIKLASDAPERIYFGYDGNIFSTN